MNSLASKSLQHLSILFFLHLALSSCSTIIPRAALPTKSGYLPINPTSSSAIFYAFYEAQNSSSPLSHTPLLIWLQGGPGCSSMIGNLYELGPWRVNSNLGLEPNSGSWNRIFGLIFLDNPIGTGFSIASTTEDIPRDQSTVAKHLFAAITNFLDMDLAFKSRPIYITGESYAGKYAPSLGYYILKENEKLAKSKRLNLAGVAIGNGLTDPVVQVSTHAKNAYYSGFINDMQKAELENAQMEAVRLTKMRNWSEATNARNNVLRLLQDMTSLATLYNFNRNEPYRSDLVGKFLQSKEVKKAFNANESIVFEECSDVVGHALHADVMKSVKYKVEFLVRKTKVLLYQGHFDLRDGVVSTEAWMKTMKWDGIDKFLKAERVVWRVEDELAGYVQKWGNLSHVVVLRAGHFVPTDQDVHSQAMIEDWVLEKGLFQNEEKNIHELHFPNPL